MKPFIHLFRTPKNHYFFDVNRNENIRIEKETYEYLEKTLKDEIIEENVNIEIEEELEIFKQNGYLSKNRIKEIRHPETDMVKTYFDRKLNQLVIQLTQNCNLRCTYCTYTSNDGTSRLHQNKKIDFDTIRLAISYLRDRSIDNDETFISFYGGEPLLEFDLIKQTVELCKEEFMGKTIKYNITTNGTLISEEILEFMQNENFAMTISLDGPKEINDKNRRYIRDNESVFDNVIGNIEKIQKNYKILFKNISINMVIDPTQEFNKYNLLFEDYPILKEIEISATLVEDSHKVEKYELTRKFAEEFQYSEFLLYLEDWCEIEVPELILARRLFNQKHTEYFTGLKDQITLGTNNCPSGPCIPGKTRLMIDVNGDYYPCEKVSEKFNRNIIGNVQTGLDIKKTIDMINITKDNVRKCKDCFAFRYCKTCIASCTNKNDEDIIIEDNCKDTRYNFHSQLIGMKIIEELRNDKEHDYV